MTDKPFISIAAVVTPEVKDKWNETLESMKRDNWRGEKINTSDVLRKLIVFFLENESIQNEVVYNDRKR